MGDFFLTKQNCSWIWLQLDFDWVENSNLDVSNISCCGLIRTSYIYTI